MREQASPDAPLLGPSCGALVLAIVLCGAPASHACAQIPVGIARALAPRADGWPIRWPRAPLLDRARDATGTAIAWERHATMGEGATICVVDTGIDLHHRDFRDADGRTRVRFVVDLGAAPRGEEPDLEMLAGAAIWSARSIDDALALGAPLPTDRHGHGTAITSAAVGDDASDDPAPGPLAGIAPRASLIVVRALRDGSIGFEDRDVALGVELCFALADRDPSIAPSRTVALLALGGHDGAHDGSEPLERAIAAIADEGRAIVVAAGNDGDRAVHASGRALASRPLEIDVHVPSPRGEPAERHVALAIRTRGRVSLRAPDGSRATAPAGERAITTHAGGTLLVDARDPATTRAVIGGGGDAPALRGGDYHLIVEGDAAEADAWITLVDLGAPLFAPAFVGARTAPGEVVTIPATAPEVIAVGATVSRDAWGEEILRARDDGTAALSARGPSASGLARPDLVAPGGFVIVALSQDLVPGSTDDLFGGSRPTLDRRASGVDRVAIEGSSVAAAIVAGAHALAYAISPADPERDRALLRATARAEIAWSDTAGAGALRIDAWLAARAELDRIGAIDPSRSAIALSRTIAAPRAPIVAIVRALDGTGAPLHDGALVVRSGDRVLARARVSRGIADVPLTIDVAAGETMRIDAEIDGVALAPASVAVRIDEGDPGALRASGGGCAISGIRRVSGIRRGARASIALTLPLALALTLLRARDRRRGARRGRSRPARRRPASDDRAAAPGSS